MGLQKLLLLNMTEHWKIALGSSKMVGVLFIDFKKAFDSVNHKILLSKVQGMGTQDWVFDAQRWDMEYRKDRC